MEWTWKIVQGTGKSPASRKIGPVWEDCLNQKPSTKEVMTCFCSGSSCGYPRYLAASTTAALITSLNHLLMLLLSVLSLWFCSRHGYVILLNRAIWLAWTALYILYNSNNGTTPDPSAFHKGMGPPDYNGTLYRPLYIWSASPRNLCLAWVWGPRACNHGHLYSMCRVKVRGNQYSWDKLKCGIHFCFSQQYYACMGVNEHYKYTVFPV